MIRILKQALHSNIEVYGLFVYIKIELCGSHRIAVCCDFFLFLSMFCLHSQLLGMRDLKSLSAWSFGCTADILTANQTPEMSEVSFAWAYLGMHNQSGLRCSKINKQLSRKNISVLVFIFEFRFKLFQDSTLLYSRFLSFFRKKSDWYFEKKCPDLRVINSLKSPYLQSKRIKSVISSKNLTRSSEIRRYAVTNLSKNLWLLMEVLDFVQQVSTK